jgi:PAS domain S-box-containing protein
VSNLSEEKTVSKQNPEVVVSRELVEWALFPGGGHMSELVASLDWSNTLGEFSRWHQSLRTSVSICLASRFPIVMYWGPEFVVLYNDAYSEILGRKHPWALGRRAREVWAEIWDVIGPMLNGVIATGQATLSDDLLLFLERDGYPEECYFSFSFSPVHIEAGVVGGVFCAVKETTKQVIGDRRLRTLRDLAARTSEAKTVADACLRSAEVLGENASDVPFALIYLLSGSTATLAGGAGIDINGPNSPTSVSLSADDGAAPWDVDVVARTGHPKTVDITAERFRMLPRGRWSTGPDVVQVFPLGQDRPFGVLVAAVNPHRKLDDEYVTFLSLLARQVTIAISDARAHEEESQRIEALAELDRTKTVFFSNVSHEFRTPLALILGPITEILARTDISMEECRTELALVHRNGLRLLKLVNTLLEFSQIEAGGVHACYEPTDLAALTTDLASVFHSAIERAGLCLIIQCPRFEEPVFVDREMWEKIVLNLLSNALKHTFTGEISVSLETTGNAVELSVRDTGIGIDKSDLAHVFDRFHRVEGARGRSREGSGIGLALVQELARLHGGNVRVESRIGRGTTFTVSIPRGRDHLPSERVGRARTQGSIARASHLFVEEALRWLPDASPSGTVPNVPSATEAGSAASRVQATLATSARILLADDNADMRDYLRRLLSADYTIETVADGEAALAAIRSNAPDLLLADVMMPRLDGFSLLRAIRNDPEINKVPVILLSARAGEEARMEGLKAGADDYLTKPFSARELLVRVASRLEIARLRYEAAETEHRLRMEAGAERQRLRDLIAQAPAIIAMTRGPHHILDIVNEQYVNAVGRRERDLIGKPVCDALPEIRNQNFPQLLDQVFQTGQAYRGSEVLGRLDRHGDGHLEDRYFNYVYQPSKDASGRTVGIIIHAVDVTEQVLARQRAEEGERKLRMLADSIPQLAWMAEPDGSIIWYNQQWYEYTGTEPEQMAGWGWQSVHDPETLPVVLDRWRESLRTGSPFEMEYPLRGADGTFKWFLTRGVPLRAATGEVVQWFGTSTDITESKRIRDDRALLLACEQDARATAELLNQVGPTLLSQRDLTQLVQSAIDLAATGIGAEFSSFLYNAVAEKGESYTMYACSGPTGKELKKFSLPRGAELFRAAFQEERIFRVIDVESDPRFGKTLPLYGVPQEHLPVRSYLAAQVISRSREVLGAMFFAHSSPGRFTDRHEAIVTGIAAQAAIAIDNAQLFEQAQHIQQELQRSNEELRRMNKDMETFAYSASHDLEEPLRNITMSTQLLKRDHGAQFQESAVKLLDGIMDGAMRMEMLVRDLMAYSRATRTLVSVPTLLDARAVLTEVLLILKARIEETAAVVIVGQLPSVMMHRSHLSLLFQNLIGNALKYRGKGAPRVEVSAIQRKGSWVFSVMDNGIGIQPKYRTLVFGLFKRLHSRDKYPGSGVGLAICQRIVEQYGGSIWVDDVPGGGSIFSFSIPKEGDQ